MYWCCYDDDTNYCEKLMLAGSLSFVKAIRQSEVKKSCHCTLTMGQNTLLCYQKLTWEARWIGFISRPLVKEPIEDSRKEEVLNTSLEAVWTNPIAFKADQSDISDPSQDSLLTAWGFIFGRGKMLSLRHRPVVSGDEPQCFALLFRTATLE